MKRELVLSIVLFSLSAGACSVQAPVMAASEAPKAAQAADPLVLTGTVSREQVEAAVPDWVQAQVEAKPDAAAVQSLASAGSGAEVTIFLGTWCGDSRRELARFWRALDEAGGTLPFQVRYIAVDREKKDPAGLAAENDIRFVPTFIVRRGGQEVGRIVETSPNGVEADLLALLTGKAKGVVSASQPESSRP